MLSSRGCQPLRSVGVVVVSVPTQRWGGCCRRGVANPSVGLACVIVGAPTQRWGGYPRRGVPNPSFGWRRRHRLAVVTAVRQWWLMVVVEEKLAKTRQDFHPVSLRDAPPGPPTCWVPPLLFFSPIPPSSEVEMAHIPLERGGARVGGWPRLGRAGTMGGEGGGSGRRDEPNINC